MYANRSFGSARKRYHALRPFEAGWLNQSENRSSSLGCSAAAKENREGTLYNLVGFQTNLKFGEQKRVFSMIPGLQHAEFMRYGVMHRNTFLNAPQVLNQDFSFKQNPNLFFAGQITGVEGYMESASSGILAGINAVNRKHGASALILPKETMMGALSDHMANSVSKTFSPWGQILVCCLH